MNAMQAHLHHTYMHRSSEELTHLVTCPDVSHFGWDEVPRDRVFSMVFETLTLKGVGCRV